jgi:hypothetical protein
MVRITRQILSGRQNQGLYEADMQYASERGDVRTEADKEDIGAPECIILKRILKKSDGKMLK